MSYVCQCSLALPLQFALDQHSKCFLQPKTITELRSCYTSSDLQLLSCFCIPVLCKFKFKKLLLQLHLWPAACINKTSEVSVLLISEETTGTMMKNQSIAQNNYNDHGHNRSSRHACLLLSIQVYSRLSCKVKNCIAHYQYFHMI